MPPTIADREYFKEVLRQKQYIVSDYMISRQTGKAVVALATPLLDEAGNVRHVLVAGLDIAWLARALEKTPVPADTNLVVVDGKGIVLAPEKWLGKSIADHPVFQRVAGNAGQQSFEARGIDGIERIFVARPLQSTLGASMSGRREQGRDGKLPSPSSRRQHRVFLLAIALNVLIWRTGSKAVLKPTNSENGRRRRAAPT